LACSSSEYCDLGDNSWRGFKLPTLMNESDKIFWWSGKNGIWRLWTSQDSPSSTMLEHIWCTTRCETSTKCEKSAKCECYLFTEIIGVLHNNKSRFVIPIADLSHVAVYSNVFTHKNHTKTNAVGVSSTINFIIQNYLQIPRWKWSHKFVQITYHSNTQNLTFFNWLRARSSCPGKHKIKYFL
jgi:hypothetical protein